MSETKRRRRKLYVTNSELGTLRSCRRKWGFGYKEMLRPIYTARPLAVGSAVHAGVGHAYRAVQLAQMNGVVMSLDELVNRSLVAMDGSLESYLRELFDRVSIASSESEVDELVAESESSVAEAKSATQRFIEAFLVEDQRRYEVVSVEQPFHVPLRDAIGRRGLITWSGVFDLVLHDRENGDVVLGEHKTTSGDAHEAERKLDMDPQTTGYVYALGEMVREGEFDGWLGSREHDPTALVGRVFYNVIRKKPPQTPTTLKDGTVSVAACDTTRDVYRAALDEQAARMDAGWMPEWLEKARAAHRAKPTTKNAERVEKSETRLKELLAKQEVRAAACASIERYVARHEAYHGLNMRERWRSEIAVDARILRASLRDDAMLTRNPENCNKPGSYPCAYRSLCIEDTPELRESRFTVRDSRHSEVVAAEQEALDSAHEAEVVS